MKFSHRMGFVPVRTVLQIDNIDDALRNKLWNVVEIRFQSTAFTTSRDVSLRNDAETYEFFVELWHQYFKVPTDTIPHSYRNAVGKVRSYFLSCEWHEAYDFVEFLAQSHHAYGVSNYHRKGFSSSGEFIGACNRVLKEEMSGYRFLSGRLVQITGEDEIAAIEEALRLPDQLKPVSTHLQQALTLLADRKAPDFRNSIKESISAIESLCKLISGLPKATLGPALSAVRKATSLHPSLNDAFHNLYGFTSDDQGIRHALLEEATLDLEDAKFMLVSCSTFANYMVVKAQKAGISI